MNKAMSAKDKKIRSLSSPRPVVGAACGQGDELCLPPLLVSEGKIIGGFPGLSGVPPQR